MKYFNLFLLLIAGMLVISPPVNAQDGPPPDGAAPADRREGRRPNLLAELGLSREQVQQIRRINQGRRPAMMEAQRRMREANRDLDIAIYGETVSESGFQSKLAEFQAAQAELARLRFESELSVRRVLTPDQLIRFRDLRRRFTEGRGNPERLKRRRGLRPQQEDNPAPKSPLDD